MKKTETVIHIPERGCHNCRLHCVNHRTCDSESPCKQGGEWRPIVQPVEPQEININTPFFGNSGAVIPMEAKQTATEWFDKNSMNYNGIKSRHSAIQMIKDYCAQNQQPEGINVTDEEIMNEAIRVKKQITLFPFDQASFQMGAELMRDGKIKSKQP